jgi:UDP-galactopyranose mutase
MNKNFEYDYLIVGAGLWGCVFAYEASLRNKKCLVIDKRLHTGGNVYCDKIEGINVHKYGAHIFHTNDEYLWSYVNQFAEFNNYVNSPVANFKGELYNLPFNMNTFYALWKVKTPEEAKNKINEQIQSLKIDEPSNLEEQALKLVGIDIYEKLIKGYTEKQWGKSCRELPAFIIKRLPIRFTFNNNYFNDRYQGIPIGGYNEIINKMLSNVEVLTNADYFSDKNYWKSKAEKIVYTGKIDQYFDYRFGELEYRTLEFEQKHLETDNYQGNAVVNYTDREIPYTRIIEHKHFEFGTQPTTIITYEYSKQYTKGCEPYYPINDEKNTNLYNKYRALKEQEENMIFGGRLAEYRYYDMHQVIASALTAVKKEFKITS